MVIDQTASGELKGARWMAPELIVPERFKFVGEPLKQLPSKSSDIYAIGMTILEVWLLLIVKISDSPPSRF